MKRKVEYEAELPAGAAFHEGIAAGWTKGYSVGSFGRRLSSFMPILDRNVKAGESWLDLGCGSGVLTKELLARGASVFGVDGSPSMLREAKAHVGEGDLSRVTWIQSDAQSLSQLPNSGFDGVLCSSVIEYVARPSAVLSEVARVLRSDGKLIVSVPPSWSAVRTVQKVVRETSQLVGRDVFAYLAVSRFEIGPKDVCGWMTSFGFVLDRITNFDPILPKFVLPMVRPALMILEAHKKLN